ncbi:MAG: hypothetical protein AAFY64_03445, partial [Pseudomonadota bacterium]
MTAIRIAPSNWSPCPPVFESSQLRILGKAPILFVNYERAVADDAAKAQMVAECAAFAGIELTDELAERATSMMTGDG